MDTIANWQVKAICPYCKRHWYADAEHVLYQTERDATGAYVEDDLCSEYGSERPDTRQDEW
jgi:hypothetical protein